MKSRAPRVPRRVRLEPAGPGDVPRSRVESQTRFFDAVREMAPAVLDDLAGEPLDLARALPSLDAATAAAAWTVPGVWRWGQIEARATVDERFERLRDAVLAWADRYHLGAAWCLEAAILTLSAWCAVPEAVAERRWSPGTIGHRLPFSAEQLRFDFTHSGWDLNAKSRAEAAAAIRAAFDEALEAYLDRVEREALERGLEAAPETRRDTPHFGWLALYQCGGLSQAVIAEQCHADRTTVRDGLRAAARAAGLPLRRPSRPGRRGKAPAA